MISGIICYKSVDIIKRVIRCEINQLNFFFDYYSKYFFKIM